MSWMGVRRGWRLSKVGGVLGSIAAVAGILLGVFPLDFEREAMTAIHVFAAFVFFILGWIAISALHGRLHHAAMAGLPSLAGDFGGRSRGCSRCGFLVTVAIGPPVRHC